MSTDPSKIDQLHLRHRIGQETISLRPPRDRGSMGITVDVVTEPDDQLDAGYYEAYARLDEQSLGRLLYWLRTGVALPRDDERIPTPFTEDAADRRYEVHAVQQVPGVVDSWVGDYENPEQDVPEIVEEISSAMASALIDEPEDHSIVAVVIVNPAGSSS